jgi:hypothetical protein
MAQVGRGFIRARQSTEPATPQARAIERASADSAGRASVPHDSRSGIDKAVSSVKSLAPSTHGGIRSVESVTPLPPSAKAPRR